LFALANEQTGRLLTGVPTMGFSITHLVILLVIVVLIFGTKKLSNMGKDLGEAVKGFKDGVAGSDKPPAKLEADVPPSVNANAAKDEHKV
jgi:sec-independent protein translocase protein TatA